MYRRALPCADVLGPFRAREIQQENILSPERAISTSAGRRPARERYEHTADNPFIFKNLYSLYCFEGCKIVL
jgi:hypothetical protein